MFVPSSAQQDSYILGRHLQGASERLKIAYREWHLAHHHLHIIRQRFDELEKQVVALRYAVSRKPDK